MAIHVCFKYMFQIFHLQTNVASILSGCCIYMHVASICFKCFQVFHTYVCECFICTLHMFAMVFKCFSGTFASVLDACFKCFICLLLYVVIVASGCFKSRSSVAHRMCVGSSRRRGRRSGWRGRHPGRCGPTAGALPREPDALCACCSLCVQRPGRTFERYQVCEPTASTYVRG
jgi:hypothetical protein